MSTWHAGQTLAGVPTHCRPQTEFLGWISETFNNCVPTPLALLTTVLGSMSFLAWLFAQLPQIYKNYQVKSTAGLSFLFLLVWLLGDTTNLVGAILTRQASWQILVAAYYTVVDCILVFQYGYYTHYVRPRMQGLLSPEGRRDAGEGSSRGQEARSGEVRHSDPLKINARGGKNRPTPETKGLFGSFRFGGSPGGSKRAPQLYPTAGASPAGMSPKTVLTLSMLLAVLAHASPVNHSPGGPFFVRSEERTRREIAGTIISWISTLSYLASRFPQILKNYRRKSTAGLSITLFIAAFFGNFFYSTSLLTNPLAWGSYPPYGYYGWADGDGSDQRTWVLLALPFFLGAAGVLSLDLTVFIQFMIYGGGAKPIKVVPVPDERGRLTFRRVDGWMRGWVPSPGPGGWRSRFSSREHSRANSRDESRPLLAGGADEVRPGSPLNITPRRPIGSPHGGSPRGDGPLGVSPNRHAPLASSPLARETTYGTN